MINNPATVRSAVSTIRYELDPSAAANIDDDQRFAMLCFEKALLEVYENAAVTVVIAIVGASCMEASGRVDGSEFVVRRDRFGATSIFGIDVTRSVEHAIEGDDGDVFERACCIADE